MNLQRRLFAEWLGTAFLLATVVGSGIMAERLSGGNVAIALLANAIATGAVLCALILTFAETSGAHFNPAVTLAATLRRELSHKEALLYICGSDHRRVLWRSRGTRHVRPAGVLRLTAYANRPSTVVERVHRYLWPVGRHPRLLSEPPQTLCHSPWRPTSSGPTGLPRLPRSPTRQSPSPEPLPTHSPEYASSTHRRSS